MTQQEDDEKYVCHDCIGDDFLSLEVKATGTPINCTYCDCTKEAISIDSLSDRVHGVIHEHFVRTSNEPDLMDTILIRQGVIDVWLPDGQQTQHLIFDLANVSDEIAEDVAEILAGRYAYQAAKDGDENPYGDEAHYEERSPDDTEFRSSWESFCHEIMYEERFFPRSAEPVLKKIFGGLDDLSTYDGTPVISKVTSLDEDFQIWRARTAQSDKEIATILESPDMQLGPPPSSSAEVGRMNPKGVSVFYGATCPKTCIAEVRPPVGSHVVLGRFRLLREVKLLDLGALSRVFANSSHFDPKYGFMAAKTSFIRHLVSEISRPVMPTEVDREYLPTQYVASYLAQREGPNLDGIIFPSTQGGGDQQNIALFNHARGVDTSRLPKGSEMKVYIHSPSDEDDDDDDHITIFETVPSLPQEEDITTDGRQGNSTGPINLNDLEEKGNGVLPTLKLDIKSLNVRRIRAVEFESPCRSVTLIQQTKEQRDSLAREISKIVSSDDFDGDF